MGFRAKINSDFDVIEEVSSIVSKTTGVQLGAQQRSMVESRLQKRMGELGIRDLNAYHTHLLQNKSSESLALVSLLTTHHTYFFREFSHFEYLERVGLKRVVEALRSEGRKVLRVWSAACSTGQEVYSISMFLAYHLPKIAPELTFEILGTDVDESSIRTGQNGVYLRAEIKEAPLHYIESHWAAGTGEIAAYVKAKKTIKDQCRFEALNLLQLSTFQDEGKFDLIFCRNVFIYFSQEQFRAISQELIKHLAPEGLLFIGVSESIASLGLALTIEGPSIYGIKNSSLASLVPQRPLKILCVDDSPSILALLKKILSSENGFEVVDTAGNGIEAAEKLKTLRVDLVTLDIHMPEQSGLEYLKKNFTWKHPPVVMISSVTRENADLAIASLEIGASDYVEKPSLQNMATKGDEIRTKLLCAYRNRLGTKGSLSLDKSFAIKPIIQNAGQKLRIIFLSLSDRDKLKSFFQDLSGNQPPTIIFVEGADATLRAFSEKSYDYLGKTTNYLDNEPANLYADEVFLADFSNFDRICAKYKTRKTSIIVFGETTKAVQEKLASWKPAQVLLEDLKSRKGNQASRYATDITPTTSFGYMSCDYLKEK